MHTISHIVEKIKSFIHTYIEELGVSIVVILVAFASFYLGRASLGQGGEASQGISIENSAYASAPSSTPSTSNNAKQGSKVLGSSTKAPAAAPEVEGQIVASKNGKRYYYPWCSGVSRISASNIVHFASAAEAEKFGLSLAANCVAK